MTGETEDDKNSADASTDAAASETKDDVETKEEAATNDDDDKNKRKVVALTDGSPNPANAEEDELDEPRAKRQKQEETGNKSVDDDAAKQITGEEKEGPNSEKLDEHSKSGEKDDRNENDSTLTDKKDVKDMEIEENTDSSNGAGVDEKTADGKDSDKENEAEEKKNDDHPKHSLTSSANGNQEHEATSATNASDGGSPDAIKTVDDGVDKKSKSSNPYDSLKYVMVRNDGKPESLIKLVALKSLFSRQLPKMPRTYIARLVFDRKHISLVILNDDPATKDTDEEVIGSICYRPFYDMRFAEIAFCAVNASHQVKGYGTKLMNLVKKEGARTGIEYFITYADNYAIGYFKKQGFTKTISMPKGRYQGLIKEYDGGTMMECYVHPSIDFTRIPEMLAAQREFILSRIKLKALSHKVVYDPLPKNWKPHLEGVSRANESAARSLAVPGMIEAGWTIADLMATTGQGKDLDRAKNALKSELMSIIRKVEDQQYAWPFREPVDTTEVNDYLDVIKEPIDLSTIDKRIRKGDHYKSKKMLYADLMLMVNNCKLYNDEASTYVQCAVNLERFLKTIFGSK
jgi:histone acetyltransferase